MISHSLHVSANERRAVRATGRVQAVFELRPFAFQRALRTGDNLDLKPELADTWTVGAVLAPSFLPGFQMSVDYYQIEIKDVITTLAVQAIVK